MARHQGEDVRRRRQSLQIECERIVWLAVFWDPAVMMKQVTNLTVVWDRLDIMMPMLVHNVRLVRTLNIQLALLH